MRTLRWKVPVREQEQPLIQFGNLLVEYFQFFHVQRPLSGIIGYVKTKFSFLVDKKRRSAVALLQLESFGAVFREVSSRSV